MTKVFISYSRKDKVFAGRLTEFLENSELETWIDWEDIPPTADWLDQIHKGIQEADAFLFLLSPDSIVSKVCRQEVDHAVQNGKRLIPIVARDVNPDEVHPALAKVNWIYARDGDGFEAAMAKTLSAVRTDLEWVEAQRRLQVRALEWEKRSDRSLLLRGKDLRGAEEQLAIAGQKDPQPTDLQRRYLLESRRSESRTRNLLLTISAVVMVALAIASVIAVNQSSYATSQAATAVAESEMRSTAEANAVAEANTRATAQANAEEQTRIALSNGLSSSALLLQEKKEISLALLLSVQANQFAETARSKNALYTLLKQNEYLLSALPMPENVVETYPSFSTTARNDLLLARIYDFARGLPEAQYILWDLNTFQLLDEQFFPADNEVTVDPNSRRLLPNASGQPFNGMIEWDDMGKVYLGPFRNQVEAVILLPQSNTAVASFCKFSKHMASRCVQLGVFVFSENTPYLAPQTIPAPESALNFLKIAYDQNDQLFALADAGNGVLQLWQAQDANLVLLGSFDAPGFVSFYEARGIELIPDRQLVAWGTSDNRIIFWDLSSDTVAQEYQFEFQMYGFAVSPDGRMVAIRSDSGTKVFIRDQAGIQPVETGIEPAIVGEMGFDGSAQVLAIGDGTQIWVFDTSTWSQIRNIKITSTGDLGIFSLSANRDGTTIAVGMSPVQAGPIEASYLIDIQTGLETGPFSETVMPILNPDNSQLVSMNPYSSARLTLWNLDIRSWIAHACQIASRNLTYAEWGQYMGQEPYQLTCPDFPVPDQAQAGGG